MRIGFVAGTIAAGLELFLSGCVTPPQPVHKAPDKPILQITMPLAPKQEQMGIGTRPDGTAYIGRCEKVRIKMNPGDTELPPLIERVFDPDNTGSYTETNFRTGEMKYVKH